MNGPLRIALTGPGGRLGSAIASRFGLRPDRFEIVPLGRDLLDLNEPEKIESILAEIPFDVIVNTAAMTSVDGCEGAKEQATRINVEAPEAMARSAVENGARMIHVSTDYVLDGAKPGLRKEEDIAEPDGVYARTKLEGEKRVLSTAPNFLVLRTSWLFGPDAPSFIDWVVSEAREKETVRAVGDKESVPTSSTDFAQYLEPLLLDSDLGGVIHLCNAGSCTWQEFAQEALRFLDREGFPLKTSVVESIQLSDLDHFVADRPRYTAMSVDKYERVTGVRPRPWEEALQDYLRGEYLAKQDQA